MNEAEETFSDYCPYCRAENNVPWGADHHACCKCDLIFHYDDDDGDEEREGSNLSDEQSAALQALRQAALSCFGGSETSGVNHEEAKELASLRRATSNLARCYLELDAEISKLRSVQQNYGNLWGYLVSLGCPEITQDTHEPVSAKPDLWVTFLRQYLQQKEIARQRELGELEEIKTRYDYLKAHTSSFRSGPFYKDGKATYTRHWDLSVSALPLPADTFDEAVDLAIEAENEKHDLTNL